MQFDVTISTGSIKFLLHVEQIATGKGFERFKVTPKNNPDKFVIIQNNRPLIRTKLGLKHKPLTWTVKEGEIHNEKYYQQLLRRMEEVLEPQPVKKTEKGYFEQTSTSNRKKKPKERNNLR